MKTTENKHIARSIAIFVALVLTTVVAAGTPIMLAQHGAPDRPVPAVMHTEQSFDGR